MYTFGFSRRRKGEAHPPTPGNLQERARTVSIENAICVGGISHALRGHNSQSNGATTCIIGTAVQDGGRCILFCSSSRLAASIAIIASSYRQEMRAYKAWSRRPSPAPERAIMHQHTHPVTTATS